MPAVVGLLQTGIDSASIDVWLLNSVTEKLLRLQRHDRSATARGIAAVAWGRRSISAMQGLQKFGDEVIKLRFPGRAVGPVEVSAKVRTMRCKLFAKSFDEGVIARSLTTDQRGDHEARLDDPHA